MGRGGAARFFLGGDSRGDGGNLGFVRQSFSLIFFLSMQTRKIDTPHAFSTTFGLLCVLQALTALAALRLPLRAAHREKPAEAAEVRVEAAEALGE